MNKNHQGWRLPAIATTLAVAACSGADTPAGSGQSKAEANPSSIEQSRWIIASINGDKPAAGIDGWLEIDLASRSVSGNSGCNNFFANFEGDLEDLTMGPVAGTKKMCPDEPMAQEKAVYEVLSGVTAIRVSADGELVLQSSSGEIMAKPAPKPKSGD